uniref:3-ketodihydrosphingosine reductase tsc-10 n=1 Tax=Anthurium amnicola TaxID=1678845 RepID=A0A1D1YLV4_9ARAE
MMLSLNADFKTRPELSKIIVRSTGNMMKPVDVATIALDGIKAGKLDIHLSFLGCLMSVATAGCSPQRSFLMAFAEVIGAGFVRLVAILPKWLVQDDRELQCQKEKRLLNLTYFE